MESLAAAAWAVARAGFSYAVFAAFGGLCAFCALALDGEGGGYSRPSPSPVLADFFADASAREIELSPAELSAGVYYMLIEAARAKSPESSTVAVPDPPAFALSSGLLEIRSKVSLGGISGRFDAPLALGVSFGDSGAEVKSARIGRARMPLFIARRVADGLKEAYGFPEGCLGGIKIYAGEKSVRILK